MVPGKQNALQFGEKRIKKRALDSIYSPSKRVAYENLKALGQNAGPSPLNFDNGTAPLSFSNGVAPYFINPAPVPASNVRYTATPVFTRSQFQPPAGTQYYYHQFPEPLVMKTM